MKDGSDKSLAIPIGISTLFEPPSLLDLLFEELDFPLEVDVVETFEVLVPDFLHVETVDGADVHALLAADALRVVELGNNDRFPLPVVRPVEHVDATRGTFPLAFPAADADVDLEDRVLSNAVDQDDLLVRVFLRHPEFVRFVVEVLPGVVRQLELLGEVPRVRRAVLHAVPAKEAVADVHGRTANRLLHLVELRAARVKVLRRRTDLVEFEVDALVRTDLRAQLASDALEPVDAMLAAVREGQLDLLIRIEVGHGLSAAGHEAVDPGHRDERLLDRREQRPDGPADRTDLATALIRFGLGGLHTCTRPSACPSAGPRARSRGGPSSSAPIRSARP